jgi:hypothetical protein
MGLLRIPLVQLQACSPRVQILGSRKTRRLFALYLGRTFPSRGSWTGLLRLKLETYLDRLLPRGVYFTWPQAAFEPLD